MGGEPTASKPGGFALFQAESLVPRDDISKLVNTVSEMLKPLRQLEIPAPPSLGTRSAL